MKKYTTDYPREKRTINDLDDIGVERIEKDLRIALRKAVANDMFNDLIAIPRTTDIALLIDLNQKILEEIANQWNLTLQYGNKPEKIDYNTVRFGRRIKDWVTLIALQANRIDYRGINASLTFYYLDRSYYLKRITETTRDRETTTAWLFSYTDKHTIDALPRHSTSEIEVSLEEKDRMQIYKHLFKTPQAGRRE